MTTDYIRPSQTARLSPSGALVRVVAYTRLGYVQVQSLNLGVSYETKADRLTPASHADLESN